LKELYVDRKIILRFILRKCHTVGFSGTLVLTH
jgi:hypothetical protein